ncbi:uncharacterized protein EDB93DRAFT_1247513 [Suillus bovinus]|uniref:uncharacterized protein n=1 Tax=Suillus bovinus TaxID=48563 RepID=UPI001B8829E4|nr:uncharacterized protein EDB93DRAFT_1247513 [Suillus bovinus]KAG2155872.1 hypothetical protein EDB93DRAFT_1247513 [Suillus bovinus]
MCLAITNAGHKESNDFPGPTTTNDNPVNDIPGPAMPTTPMIAPSALAIVPANATTTPNPATLLPAIPAPGPPVASESAGAAAATVASEDSGPGVPDDVPVVVTAPSSGRQGRGRKAGMLAPVSSGSYQLHVFLTVRQVTDSYHSYIGSATIAIVIAYLKSQDSLKDSDDNRTEFAQFTLNKLQFLYKKANGNDKSKFQGLYQGAFAVQTFGAYFTAINGTHKVLGLVDKSGVSSNPARGPAFTASN